jgi:hypothetical protein
MAPLHPKKAEWHTLGEPLPGTVSLFQADSAAMPMLRRILPGKANWRNAFRPIEPAGVN